MRAVFGLAGVLATVLAIVLFMHYIYLPSIQASTSAGRHAQETVTQIAGIGAEDSIKLFADNENGKLAAFVVTSITPGGPMEHYFGLKKDDTIISVTNNGFEQKISEFNNDAALAKSMIISAYQNSGQVKVIRDKEGTITLPAAGARTPAAKKQDAVNPIVPNLPMPGE